jgi:ribosomal-protein-alanine N-acetyltransferase
LGCRFIPEFWERGYATESAIVSIEYGFNQLHLKEICAAAHVDNIASNKVIENVGMQLIETFYVDDALHNWYTLSKNDWADK